MQIYIMGKDQIEADKAALFFANRLSHHGISGMVATTDDMYEFEPKENSLKEENLTFEKVHILASTDIFLAYKTFVDTLIKKHGTHQLDVLHGAIGVSKEGGELLDAAYRYWNYNKPLDVDNIVEEAGDILFYLQATLTAVGKTFADAFENNEQKLSKRYKDKTYSDAQALARADKEPNVQAIVDSDESNGPQS